MTNKEVTVLKELQKQHNELPSSRLKEIFSIDKGKVLTKKNFPNIRNKLGAYMTSYHNAMYRGGFAWISIIEWKDGVDSLKQFIIENGI